MFNPYINKYEAQPADNPAWAAYDLIHICRKIGGEYIVFDSPICALTITHLRHGQISAKQMGLRSTIYTTPLCDYGMR